MRVLTASLIQETNSFSPLRSAAAGFRGYGLAFGAEVLERYGDAVELGGFVAAAREAGVELVPVFRALHWPAGPVERAFFDDLVGRLVEAVRGSGPLDGVLLALHGAICLEDDDDAEGLLLQAVRAVAPGLPLVCSLDLHAHITRRMLEHCDALVGYHTCPHVDLFETGQRAARLLFRVLRGEARPQMAAVKLPMITSAERHDTVGGPLKPLYDRARALEARPDILAASIFPVQPWLDVAELGWTTVVVADGDRATAEAAALDLAEACWASRHQFQGELLEVGASIERALAVEGGPVVLSDTADATNGGATGDSTAILEALLDIDLPGPALLTVVDPEAVEQASRAGVGAELDLALGGKLAPAFYRPVQVHARVERVGDGRWTVKGPMTQGLKVDMGRTVVLRLGRQGRIAAVVSERSGPGHDPEVYRFVGLEPTEAKLVVVKSPMGFRAAYGPLARAILLVDTPGPCSPNLQRLPYRRIPRPLFPFDPEVTWQRPGGASAEGR